VLVASPANHRYMRLSFAGTEADIAEGVDRLAGWLK
jgi:hypothetical protein